ncbi:MAG: alanine racemase [Anaerolineales bacterium]|nr:alanine racemase [Anaerolineales bacterium]
MTSQSTHLTWVEIDLRAIANNISQLKQLTGSRVMAVVKANAYGYGMLPVARAALKAGASYCAVARISEGIALREGGIQAPIHIMGPSLETRFAEAIASDLEITLFQEEQLLPLQIAAQAVGKQARVHLKVETGMNRIGAIPSVALEILQLIKSIPEIETAGIFTHYARADEADTATTEMQEDQFLTFLEEVSKNDLRPPLVHAGNSATALARPRSRFDMVRAGVSMYGLHPSREVPLPAEFQPALAWKTQLRHVRTIAGGQGISYGHTYHTSSQERIGVIPVGYGDGWRRTDGNVVLLREQPAQVVGRVCMDQCMLQLDHLPDAAIGDEVTLLGRQGSAEISAEAVADRWNTINYEVACGISARVPRIYTG